MSREKGREKQDGNTWLVLVGSWPHAYEEDGETLFRGGGMDSLTAGREREEIPFSFAAYVLRTCKVLYRMLACARHMPLYLNSTSISLDVLLTISPPHDIMVSQEKERKGNTM